MVDCDAGPAPILCDPVHQTIPCGYIPKSSPAYPCARPDTRLNSCDGSELFIVDMWALEKSSPGHASVDDHGNCVCGFYSIGHASAHCDDSMRVTGGCEQTVRPSQAVCGATS